MIVIIELTSISAFSMLPSITAIAIETMLVCSDFFTTSTKQIIHVKTVGTVSMIFQEVMILLVKPAAYILHRRYVTVNAFRCLFV